MAKHRGSKMKPMKPKKPKLPSGDNKHLKRIMAEMEKDRAKRK